MQHKLEELCQIETVLLLETVNVSYLSQEHQVCVYEKNVGQHVWWYFILKVLRSTSSTTLFLFIINGDDIAGHDGRYLGFSSGNGIPQ